MFYNFTNTQLIVAAAVLVGVVIAGAAYLSYRRARTRAFRTRFGPEYDRAVLTHGSSREAEAKLADRETRVKTLELRDLGATERERFVGEWQTVQARFVDHPKSAVSEADALISSLLVARGYPKSNFEQRAADISVSYPRLMEDYRRANAIAVRPGRVDASTEELRKAMIQYRTIFDELVQTQKPQKKTSAA
ncbi:MAG: hypothetical protein ACLPH3_22985 [Terracidiphilus sp.]|jgi:hypothetical protein